MIELYNLFIPLAHATGTYTADPEITGLAKNAVGTLYANIVGVLSDNVSTIMIVVAGIVGIMLAVRLFRRFVK